MISIAKTNKADLVGLINTSLCLVHCIATPFLIAIGIGFLTNPFFEYLFLFISFVSIWKATQNMTNTKMITLLWVSYAGFLSATIFHDAYEWVEYAGYGFAMLIIIGHLINIKYFSHATK